VVVADAFLHMQVNDELLGCTRKVLDMGFDVKESSRTKPSNPTILCNKFQFESLSSNPRLKTSVVMCIGKVILTAEKFFNIDSTLLILTLKPSDRKMIRLKPNRKMRDLEQRFTQKSAVSRTTIYDLAQR
jgi:hypothetical protein